MRDIERIFLALRNRSPFATLFVQWAPLGVDYGEFYGVVMLNPAKENREDSLIHETLHFLYPQKSERWVRKRTRTVMQSLTDRERGRLTKFLAGVR